MIKFYKNIYLIIYILYVKIINLSKTRNTKIQINIFFFISNSKFKILKQIFNPSYLNINTIYGES